MDIKIIKRGSKLQFASMLTVGTKVYPLSVDITLRGGERSREERLDAFMETLVAEGEVEDCFAAMREHPEIDPAVELAQAIESGKQALIQQASDALKELIQRGKDAQDLLDGGFHSLNTGEVIEPGEGEGICRECLQTFPSHHIAGTDNLCMNHINPGYI